MVWVERDGCWAFPLAFFTSTLPCLLFFPFPFCEPQHPSTTHNPIQNRHLAPAAASDARADDRRRADAAVGRRATLTLPPPPSPLSRAQSGMALPLAGIRRDVARSAGGGGEPVAAVPPPPPPPRAAAAAATRPPAGRGPLP